MKERKKERERKKSGKKNEKERKKNKRMKTCYITSANLLYTFDMEINIWNLLYNKLFLLYTFSFPVYTKILHRYYDISSLQTAFFLSIQRLETYSCLRSFICIYSRHHLSMNLDNPKDMFAENITIILNIIYYNIIMSLLKNL